MTQLALKFGLDSHTRLDDYVGVAAPKLLQLNGLVYLAGPSGGGKTHLLQGLCRWAAERGRAALYLPLGAELEAGVLEGLEEMTGLLCLDDIHRVLAAPDWQVALFHLINAAGNNHTRLVLGSRRGPGETDVALGDLASRLRGAYLVGTDELDDEQKLRVIRLKAARRGFDVSEAVCRFILSRARRDMHHLARLVERLDRETMRRQKKVTIPFVKDALGL